MGEEEEEEEGGEEEEEEEEWVVVMMVVCEGLEDAQQRQSNRKVKVCGCEWEKEK